MYKFQNSKIPAIFTGAGHLRFWGGDRAFAYFLCRLQGGAETSVALAAALLLFRTWLPGDSNFKNWNFGINAVFFNGDKDLRGSSEVSKLEFHL